MKEEPPASGSRANLGIVLRVMGTFLGRLRFWMTPTSNIWLPSTSELCSSAHCLFKMSHQNAWRRHRREKEGAGTDHNVPGSTAPWAGSVPRPCGNSAPTARSSNP